MLQYEIAAMFFSVKIRDFARSYFGFTQGGHHGPVLCLAFGLMHTGRLPTTEQQEDPWDNTTYPMTHSEALWTPQKHYFIYIRGLLLLMVRLKVTAGIYTSTTRRSRKNPSVTEKCDIQRNSRSHDAWEKWWKWLLRMPCYPYWNKLVSVIYHDFTQD